LAISSEVFKGFGRRPARLLSMPMRSSACSQGSVSRPCGRVGEPSPGCATHDPAHFWTSSPPSTSGGIVAARICQPSAATASGANDKLGSASHCRQSSHQYQAAWRRSSPAARHSQYQPPVPGSSGRPSHSDKISLRELTPVRSVKGSSGSDAPIVPLSKVLARRGALHAPTIAIYASELPVLGSQLARESWRTDRSERPTSQHAATAAVLYTPAVSPAAVRST
jgi:hypothetical protein